MPARNLNGQPGKRPLAGRASERALLLACEEYRRRLAAMRTVVRELQGKNRALRARLQWVETRRDRETRALTSPTLGRGDIPNP
jgi:hypothetical protein